MAAKILHYDKLLLQSNSEPKTIWNIVKTITNNKNIINTISIMNINDKLSSNPLTIANAFNSYFSSLAENLLIKNVSGKNIINNNDPITHLRQNLSQLSSSLKLNYTKMHGIGKIINSLKCKGSYSYDEISSKILKIGAPYVLSPLTHIFNKILSTGIFPERLTFSEVRPLFKKGDITEFSNYRPMSLLNSYSEIIEKLFIKDFIVT